MYGRLKLIFGDKAHSLFEQIDLFTGQSYEQYCLQHEIPPGHIEPYIDWEPTKSRIGPSNRCTWLYNSSSSATPAPRRNMDWLYSKTRPTQKAKKTFDA